MQNIPFFFFFFCSHERKEKKKNTAKSQKQWFFRNSNNETNTIEIRHNTLLSRGESSVLPFLPCQFGCWERWKQQVERTGWEIWMMIYDDLWWFIPQWSKSRRYPIFSILHNQTPNIQDSNSSFKFAMKFSHAKNTDKYSCFINFTIQDHPSIHSSIHPSIHSSTHPSIHPPIHPSTTFFYLSQALGAWSSIIT